MQVRSYTMQLKNVLLLIKTRYGGVVHNNITWFVIVKRSNELKRKRECRTFVIVKQV